jgi:chromate transporter
MSAEPAPQPIVYDASRSPPPGLFGLFIAFAKMSLMGFGGVMVWARRAIVEQHRWLTAEEFNDTFALCHFLPGPNIVNLSVVFGARLGGLPGAIAAFLGLLLPPVIIVTILGVLYMRYGQFERLQHALTGVVAVTVGLFLGTVLKMMQPLWKRRSVVAFVFIGAVFVAVGILRWPLPPVLLTAVPLSIAVTFWFRTR